MKLALSKSKTINAKPEKIEAVLEKMSYERWKGFSMQKTAKGYEFHDSFPFGEFTKAGSCVRLTILKLDKGCKLHFKGNLRLTPFIILGVFLSGFIFFILKGRSVAWIFLVMGVIFSMIPFIVWRIKELLLIDRIMQQLQENYPNRKSARPTR